MKRLLALLAIAALVAPAALAGQKVLRVVGVNHVVTDAMELKIPEFEKATGVKVALEKYGEDQLNQKLTTEFTAGASDIDVFMTRPLQEARVMERNKWYENLEPFAKKTPGYDLEDFSASSRDCVTINGTLTAIPLVTEAEVLFYRKDIIEKRGIKPPTTLEELAAAVKLVTDKKNEIYGFVARGQRSPLITQFSSFLYSHGGDWFDQKTRKASVNTPEALAAMDMYGTLLREYGPGGVLNMSWPQAVAVYSQGKAVFYTDASSIFPNMLDPAKSIVADKTGVIVFPKGPKGARMYNVTAWAIGIYSGSSQKDEAWKFIDFITNKAGITFIQGERGVQCARNSVWSSPDGVKNFQPDWAKAVADSSDGVPYDRPMVVAVGEARDIIGEAVTASIEGKDFKAVADSANARFQAILDREK
ncbi:MAG: sugar ABC transporter substrate-binding protein [Planctomycetota bacterium]|jgi:multiple sugar transport system substrate-binding protein|nr:sugar ABC transporter substrate-binding protein [Planctomycetota bacterium]